MSKLHNISSNAKRANNTVVFALKNSRDKVVMFGTTKHPESIAKDHTSKIFTKVVICSKKLPHTLASKRYSKLMARYLKTHDEKPFYNRKVQ